MYIFIPIKSHQTTLRNFVNVPFVVVDILCCLRTIYAKYLNSTTKSNNFYNSNQTYKYSITGKGWGYALLEPALKHFFLNSYSNYTGLCIFSEQEYEYILLKQMMQNRCPTVCVSAPDPNTFDVYLLFMLFKKDYAKHSISKTILKNCYHSNQTYKYNATDKVWENLLIEPACKHCICK